MNSYVQLVQESWSLVMVQHELAGTVFYARLFLVRPDLRHLFGNNIETQRQHLIMMIDSAVKSAEFLGEMQLLFSSLGERHAGYGVREEDYPYMQDALLSMLQSIVGERWSESHAEAWSWLFGRLTSMMLDRPPSDGHVRSQGV